MGAWHENYKQRKSLKIKHIYFNMANTGIYFRYF